MPFVFEEFLDRKRLRPNPNLPKYLVFWGEEEDTRSRIENSDNNDNSNSRNSRGPTYEEAKADWERRGYPQEDFDRKWRIASGNKDSPNWEAWDKVLESYKGSKLAEEGVNFDQLWDLVMRQKKLYQEELYPSSVETSMQTATKFFDYLSQMGDIANQRNIQKAWAMNTALADLTTKANEFYRREATKGNIWGMMQSSLLNAWMRDEIGKANEAISKIWDKGIEEALPNIRQTASAYKSAVDKMLEGVIPEDVIEQTKIATAEAGLGQGRFGGALESTTARNLGLTSLQIQQQGMAQIPNLINTMQALRAPYLMPNIFTPNIRTDVTYLPQPQFPTASYVSPYDPAALQQTYLSGLMQTSIVPPSSYAQMLTQQYQTQLEYQYAKEMSALNYNMFQQQMRFAQQQRWWDLAGTLLGIGGGLGIAKVLAG